MLKPIEYDERRLEGLHLHHSAKYLRYISRKGPGEMYEYKGHFGRGIAVMRPSFNSTKYCTIEYFVEGAADGIQ